MDLINIDKKLIWHPFTQEKTADSPILVTKGEGSYIYDNKGKKYLDLISSWWVNLHGHSNKVIAESIYKQALELEHIIFAGFSHKPGIILCDKLSKHLPSQLSKFFFSDNGSTSTEIALKIAYQYWYNQGYKNKKYFLSFEGSYHGDTFGAMSVGSSGFHNTFKDLFFDNLIIPYPETWENDRDIEKKEANALKYLDKYLNKYKNNIAAIIIEPLIQGASGMRFCRPEFLNNIMEILKKNDILIIFDEVMTGFARTGKLFALEYLKINPDFLCLSKGITGGFLPMALTITSPKIFEAFLHKDWSYAFAHGHSYTANPLTCSAAIASLDLTLKALSNNVIKNIEATHTEGLTFLKNDCPYITKIRNLGTIAAFDITNLNKILPIIKKGFLESGLIIRPLRETIYLIPPYSITQKELSYTYEQISNILNFALKEL